MRETFCLRSRSFRVFLLLACLFAGLVVNGCAAEDPIEVIRQQQVAGDFAGSAESLRALLAERPKDPQANFLYANALIFMGEPSLAVWPLLQAMDDPEWLVPAGLMLAQTELVTGDFNEVVNVTTRILEAHPEEVQALLYRAQAQAHWKADPEAALADANRVLELQPDMLEAYEPKILALLALDRKDEATESLAEVGRRLPDSEAPASVLAWHCSTTAIFAAEQGKPESAREMWSACLEKYPADQTVVSTAVEFYDSQRDFARSLEIMRAAFAAAPTDRSYRFGLADRLRQMGKAGEGEALLRDATDDADLRAAVLAWADLARYRQSMREHAASAEALERAVLLLEKNGSDPDPQLLFQYADALVLSRQLDRAAKVADQIEVPAQQHMIRGRIAQERGQNAQALTEFDEALRVWPNNPFARYYTALVAEKLGDFDRALEEYRYSIRISVGATDARTRAAKLLIAENQPLLAYQLLFLEAGNAPLDAEGELLSMFLMARVANPKQLQSSLIGLHSREPAKYPPALARGAEGVEAGAGPRAALSLLSNAPGLDYKDPQAAPVLRVLVRFAHGAGEAQIAQRVVDAALAAQPEAAVFQEIDGLHRELGGNPDAARKAYERALQLDANNAGALAGLGRLTLASNPAEALAFFERALAADPTDADSQLGAARALLAEGKPDEAERRIDALLEKHPFEAEAAAEFVSINLARGVVTPKTLERARRAVRFGAGAQGYDQLSEVATRLNMPAEATEAAEHAKVLRERQAAQAEKPPPG